MLKLRARPKTRTIRATEAENMNHLNTYVTPAAVMIALAVSAGAACAQTAPAVGVYSFEDGTSTLR